MKKTIVMMAMIAASMVSPTAFADSYIICENDQVQHTGQQKGLERAIERLNATLKKIDYIVSAPSIIRDVWGITVCVTITK